MRVFDKMTLCEELLNGDKIFTISSSQNPDQKLDLIITVEKEQETTNSRIIKNTLYDPDQEINLCTFRLLRQLTLDEINMFCAGYDVALDRGKSIGRRELKQEIQEVIKMLAEPFLAKSE